MIPINSLQAKIYQALQNVGIKVYDEVQEGASMPLISIGDYLLSSLEFKDNGFSFNWTINIYTEYEGKKQVNELVSKTIECLYELIGEDLSDIYSIDEVMLNEANINRLEGFYVANLSIRIEIN
ncbi:MAG: hypothetical protein J6D12_04395 [Peptostreptococcaceae bacterium]|nr:hypothetical protein [Peptostreptococcaceae bacterium]